MLRVAEGFVVSAAEITYEADATALVGRSVRHAAAFIVADERISKGPPYVTLVTLAVGSLPSAVYQIPAPAVPHDIETANGAG